MGIFQDGYPDVIQSNPAKRLQIYNNNQFQPVDLNKYELLEPITSQCLSIVPEFAKNNLELNISFIDNINSLDDVLCDINESKRVYIDSEWDPINQVGENFEVQIVQMYTNDTF